jgi:hypothetical protein
VRIVVLGAEHTAMQVVSLWLHEIIGVSHRRGWLAVGGSDQIELRSATDTVQIDGIFRTAAVRLCGLLKRLATGPVA